MTHGAAPRPAHAHGHGTSNGAGTAPGAEPPAPSAPTLGQLIEAARGALAPEVWDHVTGGAESETTVFRNRAAIGSWGLRSRVLADVAPPSLATRLLGVELALPVVLAPIGVLDLVDAAGPLASAEAAAEAGTATFLSAASLTSLEDVAAAGAPVAYQVYGRGDREWLLDRARFARAQGCIALCVTADVAAYGRRERDLRRGYVPPGRHRHGGFSGHPVSAVEIEALVEDGALPVVLKGVMTVEDARRAVELGVRVIYVSNHGGRQLDHGEATLDVLPRIAEAIASRAEIVVDGGFRRGTDVVKALALGADAVAIGRLQALALAAGGRVGLATALALLRDEMTIALRLMGVERVDALGPANLGPALPGPDSAAW